MQTITAREFNQRTSAALRQVLDTGEPLLITYRGQPRLTVTANGQPVGVVDRLIAEGRATRGDRSTPLPAEPVRFHSDKPIDEILDSDRDDRV